MIPRLICCILLLALLCSYLGIAKTQAQGCSDAGFCTMGALKPDQDFTRQKPLHLRSISFGQYIGYTKLDHVIINYQIEAEVLIKEKWNVHAKLPYAMVSGALANTHGLGDISLSLSYNIMSNEKYQLSAMLGTKIPTNNANLTNQQGLPLPSYYQTSLGTYDAIAGMSLLTRDWLFAVGYQMPLNNNENAFFWGAWRDTEFDNTTIDRYGVSRDLRRGNDMMARIEKNFRFSRFNFNIGILAIYRLNEDEMTSPSTGERVQVEGSDGLVASGLIGAGYQFSTRTALRTVVGYRLNERQAPHQDGLTRVLVNTIHFEYRF
ncbi:MAG: hypothetical protein JJT94_07535 [Bernardetiaceae bacterium]|nr:hypothetical protein [Bernardetiaceae bacterium]